MPVYCFCSPNESKIAVVRAAVRELLYVFVANV